VFLPKPRPRALCTADGRPFVPLRTETQLPQTLLSLRILQNIHLLKCFLTLGLVMPITQEADQVSQSGWRKEEDGFVIRRRMWLRRRDR
jgi:hypothetical protein